MDEVKLDVARSSAADRGDTNAEFPIADVGEGNDPSAMTLEMAGDPIVADDLASPEELGAALADLTAYVEDPASVVADPRAFQLCTRRP